MNFLFRHPVTIGRKRHCLLVPLVLLAGAVFLAAGPATPPTYRSPLCIAFSPDGKHAYVSNYTANSVSVLDAQKRAEIKNISVGKSPAGLAVSPDGRYLYVANRGANKITVVETGKGLAEGHIACGFEPLGVCLSSDGRRLYVANHISNDVSVIDTAQRKEIARIPVIRMPTFLALTPDGKRLIVNNMLSPDPATNPQSTAYVSIIDTTTLKEVALKKGQETMHILQQVVVSPDGAYAYATHLRPNFNVTPSQLSQGWVQTNALTIIPLATEDPPLTVLLDNVNSGAGNPFGLAISKDGATLFVTHIGIQQISVINLRKLHDLIKFSPPEVLSATAFNLGFLWGGKGDIIRRVDCGGLGSKGIAVSPADGSIYVANYFSDDVSVLDPRTFQGAAIIPLGPRQPMTQERRGEFLFSSALHCFQNWLSCLSCHPDVRADGVNWDLMNDGLTNPKNAKSLVGSWQTPPVMALGVRKDMETAVEKGFLFIQFHNVSKEDKDAVSAFLRAIPFIPSPLHRKPDGSLDEQAKRGEKVFNKAGCAECHPPPLYTDKLMHNVGTRSERDVRVIIEDLEKTPGEALAPVVEVPGDAKVEATDAFDTPTLLEMYRTGPFLHDGRAATMKEVLTTFNKGDKHGVTSNLSPQEIDDLVAFLMAL